MYNYSKIILTVIAVALCAIVFRLFSPGTQFYHTPTFGDFLALKDIKDQTKRKETYRQLIKRLPMVRNHGGHVDAD